MNFLGWIGEQQETSMLLGWLAIQTVNVSQLEDKDTLFSWLDGQVQVKSNIP